MARRLLAGVVLAAALGAVGAAAAGQVPILRSARVLRSHVLLQLSIVDLQPSQMLVSKRRSVDAEGALTTVSVREAIRPRTSTPTVWWESPKALRPGTYFVQVKAIESGGITGCPRFLRNCLYRWSNIRRIVVG